MQRDSKHADKTTPERRSISGPGASDFLTASGGFDVPESGIGKGTGQTHDQGTLVDPKRLTPRLGPDTEAEPGERRGDEQMTGSQTGTIGGGGAEAHGASPVRATGVDDETAGKG